MTTSSGNENHTSDFLQFEPSHLAKIPVAATAGSVDLDQEINSLFALIHPSPAADPQILQKITAAQQLLADTYQEHQVKAAVIEQNVVQFRELRHRSEKLAKFNKLQVQQLQESLNSFEQIRQEIVTAIDGCGGAEQIQSLLHQINQAQESLHQAQRQLQNHQTDFQQQLQQTQRQVENRSIDTESFLQQHKSDLNSLLSSVQVDRQQLMAMQNSVAEQLQLSAALNNQLTDQSTMFQNNMADVNKKFVGLSESVQYEKQQFYQLTAEMINKSDATRAQFTEVTKQVTKNSGTMKSLQSEIQGLQTAFDQEVKQEVRKLNSLYDEMLVTWSDTKRKQSSIDQRQHLLQNWLFSLTAAVVVLSLGILVQFLK
jgi:chromosome segregation ATPase